MDKKCGVCNSNFDSGMHLAKVLNPCMHIVCRTCLNNQIETARKKFPNFSNWIIKCPFDKTMIYLNKTTTTDDFKTHNHFTLQNNYDFEKKDSGMVLPLKSRQKSPPKLPTKYKLSCKAPDVQQSLNSINSCQVGTREVFQSYDPLRESTPLAMSSFKQPQFVRSSSVQPTASSVRAVSDNSPKIHRAVMFQNVYDKATGWNTSSQELETASNRPRFERMTDDSNSRYQMRSVQLKPRESVSAYSVTSTSATIPKEVFTSLVESDQTRNQINRQISLSDNEKTKKTIFRLDLSPAPSTTSRTSSQTPIEFIKRNDQLSPSFKPERDRALTPRFTEPPLTPTIKTNFLFPDSTLNVGRIKLIEPSQSDPTAFAETSRWKNNMFSEFNDNCNPNKNSTLHSQVQSSSHQTESNKFSANMTSESKISIKPKHITLYAPSHQSIRTSEFNPSSLSSKPPLKNLNTITDSFDDRLFQKKAIPALTPKKVVIDSSFLALPISRRNTNQPTNLRTEQRTTLTQIQESSQSQTYSNISDSRGGFSVKEVFNQRLKTSGKDSVV